MSDAGERHVFPDENRTTIGRPRVLRINHKFHRPRKIGYLNSIALDIPKSCAHVLHAGIRTKTKTTLKVSI